MRLSRRQLIQVVATLPVLCQVPLRLEALSADGARDNLLMFSGFRVGECAVWSGSSWEPAQLKRAGLVADQAWGQEKASYGG